MTNSKYLAVLFVAVVLLAVITIVRHNASSAAFERIEKGQSALEVISLMGDADDIRDCGSTLYWGGDHKPLGPNVGQCVVEYFYAASPGGWSVGFDDADRVVSKYAYVSP